MASEVINGYQLITTWSTSGSCQWAYAKKNSKEWFIKQFLAPVYISKESGLSEQKIEKSRIRCEKFKQSQSQLYDRIRKANTGNIVAPEDFFNFQGKFYAVSPRVDISSAAIEDIANMAQDGKINLLKVLTYSMKGLHENGVVHADLKPDNILLKKTKVGYTFKLIDFDASFLESEPKRGEEICFDLGFVSPETQTAVWDETVSLTTQIDIFAMGLLFHLYYTGKMPGIPKGYENACHAVSNEEALGLDSALPGWLSRLIQDMVQLQPEKRPDCGTVFLSLCQQQYPTTKEDPGVRIKSATGPEKKKGWITPYGPNKQ